jgi:hypothetical protein
MLVAWGLLALGAVGGSIFLAVRNRDLLPVAACAGAIICAFNEPIFDILARLVYAKSPTAYVAYTAFGRHIPWTLVLGYIPWVGLVPYVISRQMSSGVSRSRLHVVAFAMVVSVALVEIVNALWLKDWKYYGGSSARGVLGGGIVQMAVMPLLCGFLYHALGAKVTGWARALLGLVIPTMALPMAFASTSWPLYVSNYADIPQALHWAAAAVTIAFCVASVLAITYLAERWQAHEVALPLADGTGCRASVGVQARPASHYLRGDGRAPRDRDPGRHPARRQPPPGRA